MNLTIITLAVFFINIPSGYWRAGVKNFSLQWFWAVHIPVPIIILLRIFGEIGFSFYTYIFWSAHFLLVNKRAPTFTKIEKSYRNNSPLLLMRIKEKI